jgi:hypothetical protein
MSSGQYKRHDGFNKSLIKDGMIVIMRKDGSVKLRKDIKTGEIVNGTKARNSISSLVR